MTATGCMECGENTYSGDGAESCTSCPDDKISDAGSTSEAACRYGEYSIFKISLVVVTRILQCECANASIIDNLHLINVTLFE